jgi:hypothetical protein
VNKNVLYFVIAALFFICFSQQYQIHMLTRSLHMNTCIDDLRYGSDSYEKYCGDLEREFGATLP